MDMIDPEFDVFLNSIWLYELIVYSYTVYRLYSLSVGYSIAQVTDIRYLQLVHIDTYKSYNTCFVPTYLGHF